MRKVPQSVGVSCADYRITGLSFLKLEQVGYLLTRALLLAKSEPLVNYTDSTKLLL
jgi:hypothetical protein